MASAFLLFVLVMIPLGIATGMAAALVSFTAWGIQVPVALVLFNFPIFDALFCSAAVDACNGVLLTGLYWKDVRFRATVPSCLAATAAAAVAFFAIGKHFIAEHSKLLRGSVGYVDFALSLLFFFRWYRTSRAASTKDRAAAPLLDAAGEPAQFSAPAAHLDDGCDGAMLSLNADDAAAAEERRVVARLASPKAQGIAMLISLIMGVPTGILGFGSGMNFAVLFLYAFKMPHMQATASAASAMAVIQLTYCICLTATGLVTWDLVRYFGVAIGITVCATVASAVGARRLKEQHLILLVAVILMAIGVGSTIEGFLLKDSKHRLHVT